MSSNVRVAVVTGAGRGLGRAEAIELARCGMAVVVNDVNAETARDTVKAIQTEGGRAEPFVGDISDWETAERLIDNALHAFGDLHALVNNAGILRDKMSFNMDKDDWDTVIRVNLRGHFAPLHFATRYWRERSRDLGAAVDGRIVNTSSRAGIFGNAGQANYGATKAAAVALTLIVAREMKKYGVTCNAISPRAYTELMRRSFGDFKPEQQELWSAENVAPLVAYLCGLDAAHITGQIFLVGGGSIRLILPPQLSEEELRVDGLWTTEGVRRQISVLFEKHASEPEEFVVRAGLPL